MKDSDEGPTGLKIKVTVYEILYVTEDRDIGGWVGATDSERHDWFEKGVMDEWWFGDKAAVFGKGVVRHLELGTEEYEDMVRDIMEECATAKILLTKPWAELSYNEKHTIWEEAAHDDRNYEWNQHELTYDIADIKTTA